MLREGLARVRVTLEAFQVGAEFRGALVADVAVFFESFADNAREFVGQSGIQPRG
jgi:hypothetical protein